MKRVKGSLAVECAVLLPLVVILLALILSAFKSCIGFMMVRRAVMETTEELAGYSYLYEAIGFDEFSKAVETEENVKGIAYRLSLNACAMLFAKGLLCEKLKNKNLSLYGIQNGVDGLSLWGTQAFYADETHKALIKIKVTYQPVLLDGGDFLPLQEVVLTGLSHAFLGDNPFDDTNVDDDMVYQIGEGEKYHSLDCYLIDKTITELNLWEAKRSGYTPCSYCDPWEESKVYVSSGGLKYHTNACPHLYPELTALSMAEAEEKGLTPCGLCQSDEEYFTH